MSEKACVDDTWCVGESAYRQLMEANAWLTRRYEVLKQRYQYMHGCDIEALSEENLQQLREDLQAALQRIETQQHYNEKSKEVGMMFKGFVCPISGKLMKDPVIAADGHSYEKECIEIFLKNGLVSPKTMSPFAHTHLTPNHALKISIGEALEHSLHKQNIY